MFKIKILIFLFLIFLFNNSVNASSICSKEKINLKDFNKKPNLIEISLKKARKWNIRTAKILASKELRIPKKYKKYLKANIRVHYDNNICLHKAKLRLTGDYKDHIFINNTIWTNQFYDF